MLATLQAPQGPTNILSMSALVWSAPTMLALFALATAAPLIAGSAAAMAEKPQGHKSDKSKSAKLKSDKWKHEKVEKLPKRHSKHKWPSATITTADVVAPDENPPLNISETLAALMAFSHGVLLQDICAAATWRDPSTFICHFTLDVKARRLRSMGREVLQSALKSSPAPTTRYFVSLLLVNHPQV